MTVSKAYSILETEGLIERRRGIGLFVAKIRTSQAGRTKKEMLEKELTRAVVTAVQLGISEQQARVSFTRVYKKYSNKKEM